MELIGRPYVRRIVIALAIAAIMVTAALLVGYTGKAFITFRSGPLALVLMPVRAEPPAASSTAAMIPLLDHPRAVPTVPFIDGEGLTRSLADSRGKMVLLNIWATWCGPCRREMPTLDRLQGKLGGPDFEVVALSIDRAGVDAVRRFFDEVGVKHLAMYIDSSGRAARELSAVGLPTTLLIDTEGREVGRLVGPAEWDAPAMVTFIRGRIAKQIESRARAGEEHATAHDSTRTETEIGSLRIPITISPATTKGTDP